ncbi:MAG: hypothetical protein E7552_00720 [Ruminococcaceae bacterium]|nr:hypothetical protein [Oscillospiraceae bacterium]
MSFLVDIVLIGILLAVVSVYARRSVFSAGIGTLATAVAVVAAVFLTPLAAPFVAEYAAAPLTERAVAEELADMYSAPHLETAEETVAALPIADMLAARPDTYLRLLSKYHVEHAAVQAAFRADFEGISVVRTIAAPLAEVLAKTTVFFLLCLVLNLILQLVVRRVEQNLPPQRRYRGIKRAVPPLFGVLCGLVWSWVAVTVISWVVPQTAEQLVFLTPAVLERTDWYRWLQSINPLAWLHR